MSIRSAIPIVLLASFAGTACEAARRTTMAHGDPSSIIIFAADSLWEEIGDSVLAVLEPRMFTVRDEKMFEATYVSPLSDDWLTLRNFRQVLSIGVAGDGWVAPALDDMEVPGTLPAQVETTDVWARQQTVTAVVLPPQGSGEALLTVLPQLWKRLDERFREYARSRMFTSEVNIELRDTLRSRDGFSLLLPRIYRRDLVDSAFVFRNRAQVGGELIRTIVVASRESVAGDIDVETALAWRDALAPSIYEAQITQRDRLETQEVEGFPGAIQVHGIWRSSDPTFPAAGPFIDRLVPCPEQNRTWFLEAWLYAPGRPKYEYMIQMETLLDSFECVPAAG